MRENPSESREDLCFSNDFQRLLTRHAEKYGSLDMRAFGARDPAGQTDYYEPTLLTPQLS